MMQYLLKGGLTSNVVDNNGSRRVLNIGRDERVEPLLPGSIPQLDPQCLILDMDSFRDEVDPNSRLHMGAGTCSLPV